ncbi:insulinase family protein [Neptunicella sp. SCSIO 80796]|uniref:insulinase family protein n=1 Tax=Neptunicella plasticusilytica TaxID=3117012 RepID=UPI003A4E431C
MKVYIGLRWLVCIVLLLSSCQSDFRPGQANRTDLIKGQSDPADYRSIQLQNGLKVLLISDAKLVKAYASLSVQAGYFQDPANIAGLAHLYEHMLSKGSAKYPQTAEYKQFLADHGGRSNASTRSRSTNYYFQVANSGFAMALDRFAWQFIDPLLPAEMVYKERHAVEAEFRLKYRDPFRRKREVIRQLINSDHPYSQFSTGNLVTLQDTQQQNLQQALANFGQKYYCAPRMAAVLASPLSLEQLTQLATDKFSGVPRQCKATLSASPAVFNHPPAGKVVNIKTLNKRSRLTMSFLVPNSQSSRDAMVADYIEWLFETQNANGLETYLQKHDLIQQLYASNSNLDEGHDLFNIEFKLTNAGWKQPESIVAMTFAYIELLREQAMQQDYFAVFQQLNQQRFNLDGRHKEADDIRALAESLLFEPAFQVLAAGRIATRYSTEEIRDWLAHLIPENMLVIRENSHLPEHKIESIYNTAYSIDSSLNSSTKLAKVAFRLPELSPYLADAVAVDVSDVKHPRLLIDTKQLTSWYLPKAVAEDSYTAITLYIDTLSSTTDFDYLNPLFVKRLEMQLENVLGAASQANISVDISTTRQGLKLALSGRSGDWPKLWQDLLMGLQQPQLESSRLKDTLNRHIHSLQGRLKDRLSSQTKQLQDALLGLHPTTRQYLDYFAQFDESRYQHFVRHYLDNAHLTSIYYGHVSATQWQQMNQLLNPLASKIKQPIPAAVDHWQGKHSNIGLQTNQLNSQDSAVRLVLIPQSQSLYSHAAVELLASMLKAPFFQQLRTEEQLGYSVSVAAKQSYGQPFLSYYVQSPVAGSEGLLERVKQFNQWAVTYLSMMPLTQFEQLKTNLSVSLGQSQINSSSAEGGLRYNIRKGRPLDYHKQLQQAVASMSQETFLAMAEFLLKQELQGVLAEPSITVSEKPDL